MNGKKSRALRRLARTLKLAPENKYEAVGALRHRKDLFVADPNSPGGTRTLRGGLIRRPFALGACERRAYQEAKKLYTGKAEGELAPGGLEGGLEPVDLAPERETAAPFKDRMIHSMHKQPQGPVLK